MSYVCYSVNITAYHQHYSSTLGMLEEAANEAFKVYMTRKTQGWFRRCGCSRPSGTASSPVQGAARASYSPVPGAVSGAAKVYMTRKTQRWFRRWGCSCPSNTASSSN